MSRSKTDPLYPSNVQDKYIVRFPDGMRDHIKARAAHNRRSMNAEIICLIESALQKESAPTAATVETLVSETPLTKGKPT